MSETMNDPWYVFSHYGDPEIRTKDGDKLVAVLLPSKLKVARRIVACVNACAGIETDIIERNVGNVWKLLQQRDELLALVKRYRNETPIGHQPHMIVHLADDAIAKADGQS